MIIISRFQISGIINVGLGAFIKFCGYVFIDKRGLAWELNWINVNPNFSIQPWDKLLKLSNHHFVLQSRVFGKHDIRKHFGKHLAQCQFLEGIWHLLLLSASSHPSQDTKKIFSMYFIWVKIYSKEYSLQKLEDYRRGKEGSWMWWPKCWEKFILAVEFWKLTLFYWFIFKFYF